MRGRGFIANRFVPQQPQRETRVESGMTCEQQFNSIAENVMLNLSHRQKIIKGCEMHPQISAKCRKCQQITTVKEK